MKLWRPIFTLSALAIAFAILGVSLSSVSLVQSATDTVNSSHREFYVSQTVLPDHVGYPVLMAVDRVRLEAATPVERVYLQTEYANRRLEYAQDLLEKGKTDLAVTTLTKSQKYLLHAAGEALAADMADTVVVHLIETIDYHKNTLAQITPQLSDSQRASIDQLTEECRVVSQQLASSREQQ